jgi:uncharacterized protein (TIGR03083 family)
VGLQESRDAVVEEIAALRRTVEGLAPEGWTAPTTCPGWTAGDAAAHVAQSIVNQQAAFQNMLADRDETPAWIEGVHVDPATTTANLRSSQAMADETMGRLQPEHADRPVPLPVGTFPCSVALDIVLLEYGVHHWDVAQAVDPGATLTPAACAAVLGLTPAVLTFFAGPPPGDPLGYRLESPTLQLDLALVDGTWAMSPAPPGIPRTLVRGDDSTIALFALGRVDPTDPRLEVAGPDAATFKLWFPGP